MAHGSCPVQGSVCSSRVRWVTDPSGARAFWPLEYRGGPSSGPRLVAVSRRFRKAASVLTVEESKLRNLG